MFMGDAEVKDSLAGCQPRSAGIGEAPRRRAVAGTPCWVRTVCPPVRKRGPRADTIQSCALVAPE